MKQNKPVLKLNVKLNLAVLRCFLLQDCEVRGAYFLMVKNRNKVKCYFKKSNVITVIHGPEDT